MDGKLFAEAKNEQGYLKAGFLGFPGSGKTFTAASVAIGLHKMLKSKKPVFALDTEKGFDYLVDRFKAENVALEVAKTRAFAHLLDAIDQAEKDACILIVDSVSHFWEEIVDAYRKKLNRTQLRIQDWSPIKSAWFEFPNKFLNSKLHIILCGRAKDDMDYQMNDDTGKMEAYKAGTKMAAEKSLGYEPGLVVEMEKVSVGTFKRGARNMVNRAHILKDRFDMLDGKSYDDPTFDTFLPHINKLNMGVHVGISKADSQEVFANDNEKNRYAQTKQAEILVEEIQGELLSAYPGTSADEKKAKTDLLFEAFGTRSWAAVADMKPEQLRFGRDRLKIKIVERSKAPVGGK